MPIKVASQMPGFACLSKEDQSKVVNQPKNFIGICSSCNSSKSDTLWHRWKGHQKKGIIWSPALRAQGMKTTSNLIVNMKAQIRSLPCEA